MILTARPPFDFAKSLAFIAGFAPADGEQLIDRDRLTKAFEIEGRCVLATVYSADDLSIDVWLDADGELTQAQCASAHERIAFYLSLDDAIPHHPGAHGFHQVKFPTPFESACWAILSQRLALPIARRIKDRIRERFGLSIERNGTVFRAFPSPQRLLNVRDEELRALGVPAPKIRYLRSAIEAFDQIDERWLRTSPVDEVIQWLRAIAGVGEWSARLILIRGLGRMTKDDYRQFYARALPALAIDQPIAL